MSAKNQPNTPNFVTGFNGYNIYKLAENSFQAVKREANVGQKVADSFQTSTLLEAVSKSMNGRKMSSNQLARLRSAINNFSRSELCRYFIFARI